ncbi:MAG: NADH-quinone oxidoreductase subunit NuoE [Ignavibacteria bacterium]|jgi:NADH-quinone oxidoreductase E subunit|nr:NADH-quinone oxidoreductase subunit NuoE [Ignavibacteria bacterium]MDH7526988.1 NADH-quinone oxidoreductase subunit NuoE [Ignavibacteria bacterium]
MKMETTVEIQFTEQELQKIENLKTRYLKPDSVILEVLYLLQEKYGYISQEGMKYAAELLGITEEQVLGVVTFYTMFNTKPIGKYHLQVCTNVSCMLKGAYDLLKKLENELNIKKGETTSDGLFTISEVECLGSCGTAPVVQINEDYYENLNEEKLLQIIQELRNKTL